MRVCGSAGGDCVRTVSDTPRNPGSTPWFTGTRRRTWLLGEAVDQECVGVIRCASARARGINFQACSFNHSDISPFKWVNRLQRQPNREKPVCEVIVK